jgi:Domain of unknown function (DUF4389)
MSHPVKLVVTDDLQRSRASVFFRYLLVIPHLIWLVLWGVAVSFAVFANWWVTLFRGTSPRALHGFIAQYLRYEIHVVAYLYLLANRYPGFDGDSEYPVDLVIAEPVRQNRWTVFFRLPLAYPALLISAALAGGIGFGTRSNGGLLITIGFLGWFAALVRARMPHGMRDAGAYALSYGAQVGAYVFLLTDRYPDSDPQAALGELPAREDPVQLTVADDLRRSRLTVFFRFLLAIPHLAWLYLWGIVVVLAWIVNWFATLFAGRSPAALHRFIAAYLRYGTQVFAYVTLIANPFPGFAGTPGYPVELTVAERERQNRWTVLFRGLLALPGLFISGAYVSLLLTVAILGWFSAMVRGRMPVGLRNAAALALRYHEQLNAYLFLLTDRYPYSGPTAAEAPAAPEPAAFLPPEPETLATPA